MEKKIDSVEVLLMVLSKLVQVCVRDLDFSTLWSEAETSK